MNSRKPLDGIKVIDLTRFLAGPHCTMMLGDNGAEVLKVEPPKVGDPTRTQGPPFIEGQGLTFLSTNRNKQSVVLDLRTEAAQATLKALVARADILVENFRPGVMAKMGLDYETARKLNPRLIYTSMSGFGSSGPRAEDGAFDLTIQALGGYMSITGEPDTAPVKLGTSAFDIITGMNAYAGIVTALLHREQTGVGQLVSTSLWEGQLAFLSNAAMETLLDVGEPMKWGSEHPQLVPYKAFRAQDGWVVIGAGIQNLFEKLISALGRGDLIFDERFNTLPARLANRAFVNAEIESETQRWPTVELVRKLTAAGVPCAPVQSVSQALADPQTAATDMVVEMQYVSGTKMPTLGSPVKYSGFDVTAGWTPPPELGEGGEQCMRRWLAA